MESTPLVSVIVPTYQREQALVDTLLSVLNQSYTKYEIIVVDQTPRHHPETIRFLESSRDRIQVVHGEEPNVAIARNIGIRAAQGEILLFLDDDVIADQGLIAAHVQTYLSTDTDGVAGVILEVGAEMRDRQPERYHWSRLPWLHIRFDHYEAMYVPAAAGGNMSFKKDCIVEIGGWDENYIGNSFREETDFCFRFIRAGHRIFYQPDARLVHVNAPHGGQRNELIHSKSRQSHVYYRVFFRNNVYFYLRNIRKVFLPYLLLRLYREHVLNRAYLNAGLPFLLKRQLAYIVGSCWGHWEWLKNLQRGKGHLSL